MRAPEIHLPPGSFDWRMARHLWDCMEHSGFAIAMQIIWNKIEAGMGALWRQTYEVCLMGQRGPAAKEKGSCGSPNIISVPRSKNEWHTTEKPVLLLRQILETDAITKDRGACPVYDCTMGSGSAGVAAVQVGRQFFGMDCEPGPFAAALERMALETGETPVLIE